MPSSCSGSCARSPPATSASSSSAANRSAPASAPPAAGDFRIGDPSAEAPVTDRDCEIYTRLAPMLRANGIHLADPDVIGAPERQREEHRPGHRTMLARSSSHGVRLGKAAVTQPRAPDHPRGWRSISTTRDIASPARLTVGRCGR